MEDVRRSIEEANRRFVETFNAGDPGRAAEEVYTRHARVLPPDAPVVEGRAAIVQFWRTAAAQLGMRSVRLSTLELDVAADSACEIGHADVRLASGDEARFKYVVLWKQDNGRWGWQVDIWNTRP